MKKQHFIMMAVLCAIVLLVVAACLSLHKPTTTYVVYALNTLKGDAHTFRSVAPFIDMYNHTSAITANIPLINNNPYVETQNLFITANATVHSYNGIEHHSQQQNIVGSNVNSATDKSLTMSHLPLAAIAASRPERVQAASGDLQPFQPRPMFAPPGTGGEGDISQGPGIKPDPIPDAILPLLLAALLYAYIRSQKRINL
ncbi:MAG: hypothetical protein NC038_07090 [Paludibacter sp.]|nr:hypothetical protein [Bacteroidales bacterium]MCM1069665.1 hypothetical protein [Prevotella sp.]MCM1354311.1 hypothetical protein [Bacteroides sp.]MCM1443150.1 hypothetical protein [Muribaculum sp.]MCM1482385.1 hypothetical protein [Paludibacter sp.]